VAFEVGVDGVTADPEVSCEIADGASPLVGGDDQLGAI
jgi:hypothetical protein